MRITSANNNAGYTYRCKWKMQIKIITDELVCFTTVLQKAKQLKYENNSSLKAMKFDWCKEQGEYFQSTKDNEIVAVVGVVPF